MKVSTFKYFVKEGFSSIWTNRIMSLASIGIVVACLIIFGMFMLFSTNINFIGGQIKDQWEIKAFIDESIPIEQVDEIGAKIKNIRYVRECVLETKEQALENYKKQLGEDAHVLEGFEKHNPLRHSYIINLSDIQYADQVVQQLGTIPGIVKVKNHRETVEKLLKITEFIRMGSLWVMILLAFIAVFIISNTIKLAVFARRKEINIMKFVGATDWFIRWPFIVEGIVIGLIGALLSLVLVGYGYNYILKLIYQSINIFKLREFSEVFEGLALIFIVIGTSIGAIGSAISIRKYLRV
ncbi:permease-like cell division protein FtsX [Petroclostridium xylanilyticum]|uniref:permease-like cell division protein FtsX n=1 Tax=Petroclostridium xylanilyticum TaxID=1792311 RepID=UPI0018E3ECD8|nr:permease-like cell division protein FtsX [Petroclostridium xylanilyticum]